MKIVGVAACTVGIAHTYMAQKAIQDECAARGIECKVEAQGGLGIENELTQEDVDSADLVLESVDVGVENEDRFEQKMAEGKFLKVGTSDVIADPVKIIDQAVEIIKATGGAVDAPKAEAKAEKKAVSAAPQAPTPASKQSIFADPGKYLCRSWQDAAQCVQYRRFLFYPHRRYRRRVSRLLAGIRYRRRQRHGGYEPADGES